MIRGNWIALLCLCALLWVVPHAASAKAAGNLLQQYLNDPTEAVHNSAKAQEYLALVEVTEVIVDAHPEGNWGQTGTLVVHTIETARGKLPETIQVRFYKEKGNEYIDLWTWRDVKLYRGARLLAFFNNWNGAWDVRRDGMTDVINNVEQIAPRLLTRAQGLFRTRLLPTPPVYPERRPVPVQNKSI